jgi:DNA invertase Pin-like site-specific DNA recombinase
VSTTLTALDTITASLVARQSRTDDGSMSVEDQVAAMREWCGRQNPPIQVGAIYEEPDTSGRKPLDKRKGLKHAVEDVEAGRSQMVLTAYFDRFVRSVQTRADVLVRVEGKGGTVMTMDFGVTSNATPVSKFTGTVLAAAAELIAEQAGEKTAVTKQRNIDKGIPPFPRITPFYQRRADGRLEPHPVNAPLLREAVAMRLASPPASYTTLARWFNEHGIVTEVGNTIGPGTVQGWFASKLLVGEIHFGGFTPNLHAIEEPLLDHVTFRRLAAMRAPRGRYAKSDRLLARLGVLTCETCGARMTVHTTSSHGRRYFYYICGDKLCERQAIIAADAAEDFLRDKAIAFSAGFTGRASSDAELERARVSAVDANDRLKLAVRKLAGLGHEDVTREVLDGLQAERDAKVAEHERLLTLTSADATATTLDDWNELTFDGRRGVIAATIERASVAPGRGPGRITVTPKPLFEP